MKHLTAAAELAKGLDEIRRSPKDNGVLKLIVRRPKSGEREVLESGELDTNCGLVGDNRNALAEEFVHRRRFAASSRCRSIL